MKPLIDFKLQPVLSTRNKGERCFLVQDFKIAEEVVGGCFTILYKGDRIVLKITKSYLECTSSAGIFSNSCLFLLANENEIRIEDAKLVLDLLPLFTEDIKDYAKEYTVRSNWEQQESIHITI